MLQWSYANETTFGTNKSGINSELGKVVSPKYNEMRMFETENSLSYSRPVIILCSLNSTTLL